MGALLCHEGRFKIFASFVTFLGLSAIYGPTKRVYFVARACPDFVAMLEYSFFTKITIVFSPAQCGARET